MLKISIFFVLVVVAVVIVAGAPADETAITESSLQPTFNSIGENMTELIDQVAEICSTLGVPADQIEKVKGYVKGAIKIFIAIMKNVLA